MSDQEINAVRRRIGATLAGAYQDIRAAAELLRHRAESCPSSAEADARRRLLSAQAEIEAWLAAAVNAEGERVSPPDEVENY